MPVGQSTRSSEAHNAASPGKAAIGPHTIPDPVPATVLRTAQAPLAVLIGSPDPRTITVSLYNLLGQMVAKARKCAIPAAYFVQALSRLAGGDTPGYDRVGATTGVARLGERVGIVVTRGQVWPGWLGEHARGATSRAAHLAQGSVPARALDTATSAISRVSDRAWQTAKTATPPVKALGLLIVALLVVMPVADHLVPYLVPSPLWGGTERYCDRHALGCDLTTHFVAEAAVALLAYFAFWRTLQRTKALARVRSTSSPEEMFRWVGTGIGGLTDLAAERAAQDGPLVVRLANAASRRARGTSVLVDSILGRDELVAEIGAALDSGPQPQVIVGDSSAGKTMVLIRLADWLARRGQVPVLISLQGCSSVHFDSLARSAFASLLPQVDQQEVDKQWAELRHRGQITLLADDLDKAAIGRSEARQALDGAAAANLRLVVASRGYAVPADLREGRVDLQPLQTHDVTEDLRRLARRAKVDTSPEAIDMIVQDAHIGETPYYLSLARVLVWLGRLRDPPQDGDVRLWLLNQYRMALAAGEIRRAARLSVQYRGQTLKSLEAIAFARVAGSRTQEDIAAALRSYGIDTEVADVVDASRRLGVLRPSDTDEVRFAHPTTLAYFASCFLTDHRDRAELWTHVADQEWGPFRALTLVLAATAADDPGLARAICTALLRKDQDAPAPGANGSPAGPTWLDTALEIAQCGHWMDAQTGGALLRSIDSRLKDARTDTREQVRLLKELGRLCATVRMPAVYELLTEYAASSSYPIRRQATKALAQGDGAAEQLLPVVQDVIWHAERCARRLSQPLDDDRGDMFDALRTVAWILPCLRSAADEPTKRRLDDCQRRLIGLAHSLTRQRGLEASIAQGLKTDAVRSPERLPDEFAVAMLGNGHRQASFWFSRLLLVQALTIRSRHAPHLRDVRKLIKDTTSDEHEFVREAAKLCRQALRNVRPERFLFDDATDVVSTAPFELAWRTSQLVGDVVLALNLNERGTVQSRIAFGEARELPACLRTTRDRRATVEPAPPVGTCPFAGFKPGECLCPYTYDSPNSNYRRELTRAFCRHQRLSAARVPWHPRLKVKHVREFWSAMEDIARY